MMAESLGPIASAVIIPEQEELSEPTSPRVPKRRQSSPSDTSYKRPRLSAESNSKSPSTVRASPQASPPAELRNRSAQDSSNDRAKPNLQDERKRGKRLFGGLLTTLSQTAPNNQLKRRQEIEKRQLERVKAQKVEDESKRAERLQKLKEVRRKEQVKFDRESMRTRHNNMRSMANFLFTKTEPKLYYKPWEPLPGDTARIDSQVAEAEAVIERETAAFIRRHKDEFPELEEEYAEKEKASNNKDSGEPQRETESVPVADSASHSNSHSTNVVPKPPTQASPSDHSGSVYVAGTEHEREPMDENGEVVVVEDEDTVIY